MHRSSLRLAVAIVTTLATAVALPAISAQAEPASVSCQWTAADLPLPAGFNHGVVTSTDANGFRQAGYAWKTHLSLAVGVIWENGTPRVLPRSPYGEDGLYLSDINESGTVVGSAASWDYSTPIRNKAGVYDGLSHIWLPQNINRPGQIVGIGESFHEAVVLQPDLSAPPRMYPVESDDFVRYTGIDDAGRVIAMSSARVNGFLKSYVWSAAGVRTQISPVVAGGGVWAYYINSGRIVGSSHADGSPTVYVEWDVAGRVVGQFDGAVSAEAVNGTTLFVGLYTTETEGRQPAVWDNGQFAGALGKPASALSMDPNAVSDDGVVFGSYKTGTHELPVRWTC